MLGVATTAGGIAKAAAGGTTAAAALVAAAVSLLSRAAAATRSTGLGIPVAYVRPALGSVSVHGLRSKRAGDLQGFLDRCRRRTLLCRSFHVAPLRRLQWPAKLGPGWPDCCTQPDGGPRSLTVDHGHRSYLPQMELLKEMRSMLQGQNEKLESMYRENQELRGKVSCLTADISRLDGYLQQSPVPRILSDQNCSIPLRLQFVNSCSNDKYSTRKIEADDGTPLKVAIYDHNNRIITCEPFASMRVRIVAIHGDFDNDHKGQWTEQYFQRQIVIGRVGKENLLSGELCFRLKDGVGYLNSAKFQDNSSFVSSKKFKLGVMADDERISERIQEGITESFAVKDIRGYSTKKNLNPSPRDPVHKLSRIAMNGDRHKLLEQNGIKTVGDFLCSYSKNPEELRKILGKISDQDWDTIINHARKCNARPEIDPSFIQERNLSHEQESFSRSNGSYYLKGSCSMQPSPTLQKQLDVQETNQQIPSRCNGLSSGASSENVPREFEGIQVTDQQVSSIGNENLSVSSMDNNTLEWSSWQQPDGNGLSPGNSFVNTELEGHLTPLEKFLLNEDTPWDFFIPEITGNAVELEQNGGHSPISEAGSISHRGLSPVRGAGSRSYRGLSPSPVRGTGSRRFRGLSPSPVRGAGIRSHRGLSFPPIRGAGSSSNASTDHTDEEDNLAWFPNI